MKLSLQECESLLLERERLLGLTRPLNPLQSNLLLEIETLLHELEKELEDLLSPRQQLRSRCQASYQSFVEEFWSTVPSAEPLVWNWHMEVLCAEMQRGAERVFALLPCDYDTVFNVPFGTSKTTICSILFQPWTWTRFPQARHMTGTHTEPLGADISGKSLAVVKSDKYRDTFPEVVLEKKGDSHWTNTVGGERRTCTVGGKTPTGFHAHFLGTDDPIDPKGAMSLAELENAKNFVTQTLPSRKVNKLVSWTYLVMQRLARGDPSDVMVKEGEKEGAIPVRRIVLPGLLTKDVFPEDLGERYIDGLLDPHRLPERVLATYRARGTRFFSSQVLQNPLAEGGGMFKDSFFNLRVRAAPYDCKRVRFWDRAATQNGGCYTAGVLLARDTPGRVYVEHVVHGQWEPNERNDRIEATARRDAGRYPNNLPVYVVEAESGSTGLESFQNLFRRLISAIPGLSVRQERPTGSKDVRAEPWADCCAAKNVWCVEDGSWDIEGYIEEHCYFMPDTTTKRLGGLKDRIDASSGAYNSLVGRGRQKGLQVFTLGSGMRSKGLQIAVASRANLAQLVTEFRALLVFFADPVVKSLPCGLVELGEEGSEGEDSPLSTSDKIAVTGEEGVLQNSIGHGLSRLLDQIVFTSFADINPSEHQETWGQPVPPWNVPASELLMQKEDGKKLWSFLRKKRDYFHDLIVFADEGDRRALSAAYAFCDANQLPRAILQIVGREPSKNEGKAPNEHVYTLIERARGSVV